MNPFVCMLLQVANILTVAPVAREKLHYIHINIIDYQLGTLLCLKHCFA